MKKIKVISIVTAFPRNKDDIIIPWFVKLVHKLKRKNTEVTIFTSSYKGLKSGNFDGISVIRFRYFLSTFEKMTHDVSVIEKLKANKVYYLVLPFFIIFGIIYSVKFALKNDFDIIHVHWPFPLSIFGIAMKLIKNRPMIYTFYGADIVLARRNGIYKMLLKLVLKKADKVTVISSYTKKILNEISPDTEVTVIPFGSSISSVLDSNMLSDRFIIKKKIKEILFVGRLVERKGVIYLIRAFRNILERYKKPIRLVIVGDGPERNSLEQESYTLGIEKDVKFTGFISDNILSDYYNSADIFVLPAIIDSHRDTEGLGVVLMEAMLRGIPVVASNVGGIVDIVENNRTGILTDEKDIVQLTNVIIELLENKKRAKHLSDNAIEYLKIKFSWGSIVQKYLDIYKCLINST
ncbi:glycosyltransferase family 4 protein [candidate division WOR-3 bacterium]|jgi:glycosyltransferase involved in cell wall biosynthesis|nr:glycosyltransferase family 4 protein [candidate division WOR-3 bacterium]